jgi:hypothetical protein
MEWKTEKCKLQVAKWLIRGNATGNPRPRESSILSFQFLLCLSLCSLAVASDRSQLAQSSTQDALRNRPDSHGGDDYDRALLGDANNSDARGKDRETGDLEKKLKQQLGAAAQPEDRPQQPLLDAAMGMRDVQSRLAQGKSDAITQHVQRQIVADLQKIIDEAKKSGKCLGQNCIRDGSRSSGKTVAGQNAQSEPRPRPATGPARESDPNALHAPTQVRSEAEQPAAELTAKYNLQLQARRPDMKYELPGEHFLPEYKGEIEDYFRRLSSGTAAEEK